MSTSGVGGASSAQLALGLQTIGTSLENSGSAPMQQLGKDAIKLGSDLQNNSPNVSQDEQTLMQDLSSLTGGSSGSGSSGTGSADGSGSGGGAQQLLSELLAIVSMLESSSSSSGSGSGTG